MAYHINFVSDECTIHDVKSQKMIGWGDLCDDLYRSRLASPTPSSQTFVASTLASICNKFLNMSCNSIYCSQNSHILSKSIWHFRLRHLSNQILSQMHHVYPNIHVDNKSICDICHFAKQRKLPYSLSISIASCKYELLHFDI